MRATSKAGALGLLIAGFAIGIFWLTLVILGIGLGLSGIVRLLRFLATHPVQGGPNAE